MIVGSVICAVGSGLLTTIDTTSPTLKWAAYMVVTGIGTGICVNLPYTAVQVVLQYASIAYLKSLISSLTTTTVKRMFQLEMVWPQST